MTEKTPEVKPDLEVSVKVSLKEKLPKIAISHSKEILSAVVIGVLVTLISTAIMNGYFYQESSDGEVLITENGSVNTIEIQASQREYFIRANLVQVMALLGGAKIHLVEHFMVTGKLPVSAKEFDISILDLDEYDQIDSSFLVENGGVGVKLSSDFGEDRSLILIAIPSKNDAFLRWSCETNIDKRYLGIGKSKICEYRENL